MTTMRGRVIAITGAGGGIGRALAGTLAARGAIVALSDSNAATLAETAAGLDGAGVSRPSLTCATRRRSSSGRGGASPCTGALT
jgi:NAD(P)-dependent dehydrogenase (short-subunit alcohol dehydrogenase family)